MMQSNYLCVILHVKRKKIINSHCFTRFLIAHFTVRGRNEAGVDLVLIQPSLHCYVNHVVLMLTSNFHKKRK